MKISPILFTLCAASTPLCHSMQLILKTNNSGIKQISKIALQKEFYATSTKQKKQKEVNSNNCCIVKNKGQIKDLIVQSTDKLQSRFSTYSSNFFGQNKTINKLLAANIMASVVQASLAIGTGSPDFLLPIIFNATMMGSLKITDKIIDPAQEPQLVTDLISYAKAIDIPHLGKRSEIIRQIKEHKKADVKMLSNLDLTMELDRYNTKLAELEESKAIINRELIEPLLPIFSKHKNVDLEKCLMYGAKHFSCMDRAMLLTNVLGTTVAVALVIASPAFAEFSPFLLSVLANTSSVVPSGAFLITNEKLNDNENFLGKVIDLIKIYKEHLETEKNSITTISPKTSKKKRNTE